jgi:hypothetical protein
VTLVTAGAVTGAIVELTRVDDTPDSPAQQLDSFLQNLPPPVEVNRYSTTHAASVDTIKQISEPMRNDNFNSEG